MSVCKEVGDVGSVRSDTSDSDSESESSQVLHLKLTDSTLGEEGHPGEVDEKLTEGEGGHHEREVEKISDSEANREVVEIMFRILFYCKG